jgi:hypothetical protein
MKSRDPKSFLLRPPYRLPGMGNIQLLGIEEHCRLGQPVRPGIA